MEGGTVLFVQSGDDRHRYVDALVEYQLTIVEAARPEDALHWLAHSRPNVVVTDLVFADSAIPAPEFIRAVRESVDAATSIIVVSRYLRASDRETARAAGADLFLTNSAPPSALVFEVRRALILRRSGRRLSWNWTRHVPAAVRLPVADRRRGSTAS